MLISQCGRTSLRLPPSLFMVKAQRVDFIIIFRLAREEVPTTHLAQNVGQKPIPSLLLVRSRHSI